MNKEEVQAIVAPFYRKALTVNTETTSTAVLETILADAFSPLILLIIATACRKTFGALE
jgi:hypothetical protein